MILRWKRGFLEGALGVFERANAWFSRCERPCVTWEHRILNDRQGKCFEQLLDID